MDSQISFQSSNNQSSQSNISQPTMEFNDADLTNPNSQDPNDEDAFQDLKVWLSTKNSTQPQGTMSVPQQPQP